MDKIVPDRQVNFTINDVELQLDPIQISVYKEGLNYSWKTLRTRASSKIVNGNAVFHLKLNLIFTRSMFLEMHRLVCQMRNTPFAQIQNQFISESVGLNPLAPTFFSVNSLQLIPRADSPYTIDMELDLRYFNHAPFESALYYKEFLETIPILKNAKEYMYSFDVFPRHELTQDYGIVEYENPTASTSRAQGSSNRRVQDASTLLKRNLRAFNGTSKKILAKESKAFVRYSNYLQIRNLTECFGIESLELREILGNEVNARECKSLCALDADRKTRLINHKKIYGDYQTDYQAQNEGELFRDLSITYQEYFLQRFSKEENKAIRKHFYEKVKDEKDPVKQREIIAKEKAKVFIKNDYKGQDQDLQRAISKVQDLAKSKEKNIYTGRRSVNNVFYFSNEVNLVDFTDGSGSVITGFSCGFTNMISSLPVSGQPYPTHQYLGSSEPIYNINVIANPNFRGDGSLEKGFNPVVKRLENMRTILQQNAKNFKIIPDSGYFSVDHFFTKLLGSKKAYRIDLTSNKPENNFVLRNFNVSTLEGSPGAQSVQFSFCETNNFAEENLGGVYKLGDDAGILRKVENVVKTNTTPSPGPKTPGPRKATEPTNYSLFNWKTKFFSSDIGKPGDFYTRFTENRRRQNITEEQDRNAFEFCRDYLDIIQAGVNKVYPGKRVILGSTLDYPKTTKRKGASRHYAGCAVDLVVEGIAPLELMSIIYNIKVDGDFVFRGRSKPIGLLGYYQSMSDLNNDRPMENKLLNNFFVHVDSRRIVKRYNVNGELVTEKSKAKPTDTFIITNQQGGDYVAFDVRGVSGLITEQGGVSLKTVISDYDRAIELDLDDITLEEPSVQDSEGEEDVKADNTNTTDKVTVGGNINPFSVAFVNKHGASPIYAIELDNDAGSDALYEMELDGMSEQQLKSTKIIVIKNPERDLIHQIIDAGFMQYYDGPEDTLYIPYYGDNIALVNSAPANLAKPTVAPVTTSAGATQKAGQSTKVRVAANQSTEGNAYVVMLEEFHKLASLMLTEPELYTNSPEEAAAEKRRIRALLNDESVSPMLFSAFTKFVSGHSGLLFGVMAGLGAAASAASLAGVTTAVVSSVGVSTAGGGTAGGATLGHIGAFIGATLGFAGGILGTSEAVSTYYGGYVAENGLIEILADLSMNNVDAKAKTGLMDNAEELDMFKTYLGDADTVMHAFLDMSNYIIAQSDLLKSFSNQVVNVQSNVGVSALLGTYKDITKTVNGESYTLRGALSETLFMGELKRVFEFYFGYPYVRSGWGDEEDINDLFDFTYNENHKVYDVDPLYDKKEYFPRIPNNVSEDSSKERYRIVQQAYLERSKRRGKFPISKAELKANQERKLGYLRSLKDELLRGLSQVPEVQEALGLGTEESLFNLIESNSYPDILLPADPSRVNNNVNLHPAFYFYNQAEESYLKATHLRPELEKNITKIVGRAYDFEEDLRKGIFSGSVSELTQVKPGEYKYEGFDTLDRILLDTSGEHDQVSKIKNRNARATDFVVNATESDTDQLEERIQKLKNQGKTFRDAFGKVPDKAYSFTGSFLSQRSKEPTDSFKTKEEVIQDAIDSSKEMLESKNNIKRAFPTYKLYLIEEDAVESGKIGVYDDFYSFNGVKSFTVYEERKLPASTAIIQLQNVSGILDGTKPEVIRDIDIDQDLTPEQELDQQQFVESIVVRPGINIQLRAGYESNPNDLDIIFTGRVTEVKNSSSGDVLEVVAQSFGTETIAKKLGLQKSPLRNKTFYNTHSLLGSLCLSEELKHFGRIKKGARFSQLTNRSPALDIETGKEDQWVNFVATNWVNDFFHDYWAYIAIGGALLTGVRGAGSFLGSSTLHGNFPRVANFVTGVNNAISYVPNQIRVSAQAFNWSELFAGSRTSLFGRAINGLVSGTTQAAGSLLGFAGRSMAATYRFIQEVGVAGFQRRLANTIQFGSATADGVTVTTQTFGNIIGNTFRRVFGRAGELSIAIADYNQRIIARMGYLQALNGRFLLDATGRVVQVVDGVASAAIPGLTGLRVALNGTLGANTLVFGGFRLLRNMTAIAMSSLVASMIVDAVLLAFRGLGYVWDWFWKRKAELYKVKIMLSPQDDNIFPPKVEDYLVRRNQLDVFFSNLTSGLVKLGKGLFSSSFGLLGIGTFKAVSENERLALLRATYLKSDNRLSIVDGHNKYNLQNTTIWEVFHEMSLRHPGFVYGIRKYGSELESRLFFGRANQRCFVEPLSIREALLVKKIEPYINNPELFKNSNRLTKDFYKNSNLTERDIPSKKKELVDFYERKINKATQPFRKYHALSSERDIISNNLRVEGGSVVNQVAVTYKDSNSDNEQIYQMRGVPYLSDDRVNEKAINYPNCKGLAAACRYGMGELIHGAREMYSGEILIVGNPKIRSNDAVVLADNYLNMHGIVEVAAVTHMFGYDTGFVTEIKPNAVVFGNDSYMNSISTAPIAMNAHRLLIEKNPSIDNLLANGVVNETALDEAVDDAIVRFFSNSDSGIYNYIYSAIPLITDYSDFNSFLDSRQYESVRKQIKDKLKDAVLKNNPILLEDITKNIGTEMIADKAQTILTRVGVTGVAIGATASAVVQQGLSRRLGILTLLGLGSSFAGSYGVTKLAESSFQSGFLGRNIFKDVLMSQLEYGHLIKIIPVVKDGKPLVGGGYEYLKQHQRFKEVFGNFFNPLSDAVRSYTAYERELEEQARYLGVSELDGFGFRDVLVGIGRFGADFYSAGLIKNRTLKLHMESQAP